MYSLLLLLSSCLLYVHCIAPKCCPEENVIILENNTCWDGSNLTIRFCDTITSVVKSTQEQSTYYYIVNEDGTLMITTEQNFTYRTINLDKYCVSNNSVDNAELAMICDENKQPINLSAKGIAVLATKAACSIITVVFLLGVLIIYIFIPDLRDIEGNCVVNFALFLCVAHSAIIFSPVAKYLELRICNTITFIYFISHITSYNWLSVLSFHLWRITIRPVFRPHIRWFLLYCCYGYGIPIIILITSLILYYTHDIKLQQIRDFYCLVDGSFLVWGYFYGGAVVFSLISIIFQFLVAKRLWMGDGKKNQSPSAIRLRNKSLVYLHLLLIMVLIKIVEIITYVYLEKHSYLYYLWQFSDSRNMLVGGVIFFILVVQRKKVLKALAKRGLFCIKFPEKWKILVDDEAEKRQSITEALAQNSRL